MKTKTNKKFLSLILAISMTLTSFAGLTITTANAEAPSGTDPEYSTWDLAEATYTEDFDEADIAAFYAKGNWSGVSTRNGGDFSQDTNAFSFSSGYVNFIYKRELKYTNAPASGSFYYTYKIQGWNADSSNHPVKLIGTSEYTVATATSTAVTYTTIVDTASEKAYTYQHGSGNTKTLTDVTSFAGDTITGIKFENLSNDKDGNSYRIHKSFAYGTLVTPPDISTLRIKPVYTDDFSESFTLTEIAAGEESTGTYNENGWTQFRNGTTKFETSPSALAFQYNRWIEYRNSSTPASGLIAYRYNVKKETDTANVKIVGDSKEQIFSIPVSETGVEYTTVVDLDNKKAYNYTGNTFTSKSSFTTDNVKGIQFQNSTNDGFSFRLYEFTFGTLEEVPEAPTLSSWTEDKTETTQYTTSFTDASGDDGNNDTTKENLVTNSNSKWNLYRSDNTSVENGGSHVAIDKGDLALTYKGVAEYKNVPESGVFMYTYTIKVYEQAGKSIVKLIGPNTEIITSSANFAMNDKEYEFTTVIDEENGWAYTYNTKGDLANEGFPKVTDISSSAVTGIAFIANDIGTTSFRIADFKYNTVTDTPETLEIGIDYEKAQLTGFDTEATYTVAVGEGNYEEVTVKTGGVVDIDSSWYSADDKLTVKKTDTELSAEVGPLGAQPSAPVETTDYVITNAPVGSTDGNVKAVEGKSLEYLDTSDNNTWKTLDTTGVTVAAGSSLSVRTKGSNTNETFPSATATATVKQTYSITYNANGGSAVTAGEYIGGGDVVTFSTTSTKDGYTFEGWYKEEGLSTKVTDTTGLTENLTLYAKWTANSQTINKTTPQHGTFTVASSADTDSVVAITAITPDQYYELDTITVTKTASSEEITVTADNKFTMPAEAVTVTVTFKAINYTVTATVNTGVKSVTLTGTGTNSQTKNVENGQTSVTFSVPHDTYTISATYDTGYEKDSFSANTITPTDNTSTFTVNAKVSADPEITGTVEISGTAKVGETLTATANITNGSGDISYQWQAKGADEADTEYQNIGTASTTNTYTIDKAYEGKVIRVVVTRGGTSGSKESAATNAVAPKTYTVKGTVGAGVESVKLQKGSDAPITGNVSEGVITFTDVLEGTYTVVVEKVSSYKSASSNPATITVNDENASAYATKAFEATAIAYANPTVTIETYDTDKGTVTVTGGVATITTGNTTAKETDTITVTSEAKIGYSKATLKYKEAGDENYTDVPADGKITVGTKAITIQATYSTNSYNIDKASVTGGTISVNTTAEYDSSVSVSLTPDTGYEPGAITVTGKTSSNNIEVTSGSFTMPAEDVTVSATFTKKVYTASVSGTPVNGSVTIAPTAGGSAPINYQTPMTITVTPEEGYELDTLTVNKAISGTVTPTKSNDTTYTFTMPDDNVTVSATFKEIPQPDPTSKLSYWTSDGKIMKKVSGYPIDFEALADKTYDLGDKWDLTGAGSSALRVRDGNNGAANHKVLTVEAGTSATLKEASMGEVFIYEYNIESWNTASDTTKPVIKLEGVDGALVPFPLGDRTALYTFTTVVDTASETKAAYTYDSNDDLVSTVQLGNSAVTGITFDNTVASSGALWLDDISYKLLTEQEGPNPTVTISSYNAEQGTVAVSVGSQTVESGGDVLADETVTITIAAEDGYELDELTVSTASDTVSTTKATSTTYTFTMPVEDVTIAVTFKETVVENPEGPEFSTWEITDYTAAGDYQEFYADHFKGYDGYIGDMARTDKLEGKDHEPLPKAYWTVLAGKDGTDVLLRDTIGSAETGFMQVKHASNGTGSGSVKYTNGVESDKYYYQYDLRIGKGEIEVELAGTGLANNVIIAAADGDVAMATYTTVVDTENKKVYTYKGDTLIKVNEIGTGEVTGIIFSHVTSETASIANTGYADIDRFGHYYVEKAVDPTADPKVKITGYDNTQGTVTVTAGETTITSGSAEIAKDTSVTVTIAAEEGYELDTFTVDNVDKKSELDEGVYAFTMSETDVTITVTFKTTGGDDPEPPTPGEYPTLADWSEQLGDAAYTFEFDKTLTDDDLFGEDGIWSTDGATGNQGDVWQRTEGSDEKTVLQIRNGKKATLTKAPADIYYYTYNLYNNGANTVKLEGITDNVINEFSANKAYTQYTTVVDTTEGKVYTYEGTDTTAQPITVNTIGDSETVTGITFASGTGYMYLDSFAYGLKKGETDPDPYNPGGDDPTPPPTDEPINVESKLSDWDLTEPTHAEEFDGKSIAKLQEDDWKFGNTNAGANFNEKHVIINGSGELEVNWYGTATYGKTDEENSYYYTYTVKTKDTMGIRSVNLSGVDNSTMLVSGKEITSSDRTFTTVVDVNSKKAYTYDNATGDFVSVVDVPNPAAVKGITFSGGTVNTSVGMQVDNVSYGLVNVTPPEKPVTIVLKGDKVNDGEVLENGQTYEVTGEKFTETVIKLDEPYTVKDEKTLLFMTNTIDITSPNDNIVVDGTTITALEALTAGTSDIAITVTSSYNGEKYGSETYTIRFTKPEPSNDDIAEEYEPVITTETVDGKEVTVNTSSDGGTPTEIYNDLELPTETSFAEITWESDTPDIISNNGEVVSRPYGDQKVTLTATIKNKYNSAGEPVKKTITVTVKGVGSMLDDAIAKAIAIVSADTDEAVDLTDLHEDIKIYTDYENDAYPEANEVTLEWSSDNDVLRINGSTAEIYPTTTNEYKVKLTVKATALGAEKTEDIDVTVHLTKAHAGDKYAVRCDDLVASNFSEVANLSGDTVSSNIGVPTEGLFGSTISWTSSVPMYMSNTGKYTAPTNNTNVTMTGIVSKGKVISDKKHAYSFTVKGKSNNQSSGGSGGGGGSSSGGRSSSYSLPMNTGTTTPITNNQPSNAGNYNPNANTEPEGFTDLGNVAWAEEAINALADKGIISGRSEHIFDPDANITRAEFATIIVKAFGFEDADAAVDEFADVNKSDWYYSFVAAAYNNGIISGYDNGSFGSYDNITRQDMAVIIYRAANAAGVELDEINEGKTFEDEASIGAYAADAVDALVKAGVINGMTDTEFAPTANATRAQAAKMTYEFVK